VAPNADRHSRPSDVIALFGQWTMHRSEGGATANFRGFPTARKGGLVAIGPNPTKLVRIRVDRPSLGSAWRFCFTVVGDLLEEEFSFERSFRTTFALGAPFVGDERIERVLELIHFFEGSVINSPPML